MNRWIASGCVAASLWGCSDEPTATLAARDEPYEPWSEENTTVIGGNTTGNAPEPGFVATGQVTAAGCLQVTDASCVEFEREGRYCTTDSGPVDVIRNGDSVVEVVCYEDTDGTAGSTVVVDGDSDGAIDVPQQKNGSVLTFDPSSDGKPVAGNVTVDANNVTIYGNGPANSIIDGNLVITGNNARIRGVRVTGNVVFDLNTGALVLSVVEGNIHVGSNNVLLAENDVFGNVEVSGNNAILIGNDVSGNWQISGQNPVCSENFAFADADENGSVEDSERGNALTCK
ncbi:MAG: hypothetical protein HYV07_25700 [Deltaproteobacteria bacterium]|nr:hypothetical protein [Deltaproteobacteria bacterium]